MKTLTAKTHIARQRQADRFAMLEICKTLHWTERHYCNHQFEVYLKFLERRFFGRPIGMLKKVTYSSLMRGFFNNEWAYRDQTGFLPFAEDACRYSQSSVCEVGGLFLCTDYSAFDDFLVQEYIYEHSHYCLMDNKAFMNRFDNVLKMVLK